MAELSLVTSWSRTCFNRLVSSFRAPVVPRYDPDPPPLIDIYPCEPERPEPDSVDFLHTESSTNEAHVVNNVYCQGFLLHDVQLARLYNDSKTFVDMKLKYREDEVVSKYDEVRKQYGGKSPPPDVLKEFVNNNFENGDELEQWTPPDFSYNPSLADKVQDPLFKQWVKDLNNIHLTLSRKVKEDVKINPEFYSLLYVPNGFVIPGGRFRELYYWDTYWIIKGLLLCDMVSTARGVIENFFYIIRTYNIIPNGSRKYYLQRTQPPLLIQMVNDYYEHTKDLQFVMDNLEILEKEFNFWMENRMVRLKKNNVCHKLARYYCPSSGPRPESYREDYNLAKNLTTEEQKTEMYINLKSAAESGFDFSTRWFIKNGTNEGDLRNIATANIVPVDLNCFLHKNAKILSEFHTICGNPTKAAHYKRRAEKLLQAIHAVLWNEDEGIWLDYDLKNMKPRKYFYMSNLSPLWTESYIQSRSELSKRVLSYLGRSKIDDYIGGMPTSLMASGEQWDFPNAWPPLQHIAIEGLSFLGTGPAVKAARHYAEKWLRSNYKGYNIFHKMFEKYDVTLLGQTGTGGEYEMQTGFGWTNGCVLSLLDRYYNTTVYENDNAYQSTS